MKLHLLGTTGYHPNDRRQTSCLMLPEVGVVLDAGTGMYRVRDLLATRRLDIFLSHAHLDHILGLTFLFDILYQKTIEKVTVHGAADKLAQIDEHLFAPAIFPVKPPLTMQALTLDVPLVQGGRLSHFPLAHPGGTLGFRLDWPERSLAYVTDTTARVDAPYVDKLRGVDVLIHECYFSDGQEQLARQTGHSTTTPVAQVAKAAGVGRLILVHMNPLSVADDPIGLDTARKIFPATELGEDRMVVEF